MSSSSSDSESESECEYEPEDLEDTVVPQPIVGPVEYSDISFNPKSNSKLAGVDLDGYLRIYDLEPGSHGNERMKKHLSRKPCRCVSFSHDGDDLYVMTKDQKLHVVCATTGKIKRKICEAHKSPPNSLLVVNNNMIASGDDDGTFKLWDFRRGNSAVLEDKKFKNYISDLAVDNTQRRVFAVSGDGSMATYNTRMRKFVLQSEWEECDMLCVDVMKQNRRVVVGLTNGPLLFYNWEQFHATADRFPGHPASVECLAKVTEDIICTASSDGLIRALHLFPNRFLGVVGGHSGLPMEKIRCTGDGSLLASISHDSTIRFWDVEYLKEVAVNEREKAKKLRKTDRITKRGIENKKGKFVKEIENDFEAPVVEIDSDDASSSDESSEDNDE